MMAITGSAVIQRCADGYYKTILVYDSPRCIISLYNITVNSFSYLTKYHKVRFEHFNSKMLTILVSGLL
jgi:hypothetical protein